jgi:hypothetical protein
MPPARPFTGPISVRLAGAALLALAAASFTSSLSHQLRQPRPDNSATVVVIEPREPRLSSAYDVLASPGPAGPGAPNARPHARPPPAAQAAAARLPDETPDLAASAADHAMSAAATAAPMEAETPPDPANAPPAGNLPADPEVTPPPSPPGSP